MLEEHEQQQYGEQAVACRGGRCRRLYLDICVCVYCAWLRVVLEEGGVGSRDSQVCKPANHSRLMSGFVMGTALGYV